MSRQNGNHEAVLSAFCKRLIACDIDLFGLQKSKPKVVAQDETKWITVHPGGKGEKTDGSGPRGGTHVLIDGETGEIKGGMGGNFNGMTMKEVKSQPKQSRKGSEISTEGSDPEYSKDVVKAAKAWVVSANAFDDWKAGLITKEEYEKKQKQFKKLEAKLSPEDKEAFDKAKWEYNTASVEKKLSEHAVSNTKTNTQENDPEPLALDPAQIQPLSKEAQDLLKMWKESELLDKEFEEFKKNATQKEITDHILKEYHASQKYVDEKAKAKLDVQDEVEEWIKKYGNNPENLDIFLDKSLDTSAPATQQPQLSDEAQKILKLWKEADAASKEYSDALKSGDTEKSNNAYIKSSDKNDFYFDKLTSANEDVQNEVMKWLDEHGKDPDSLESFLSPDLQDDPQARKIDLSGGIEYSAPLGELSPVPSNLPEKSGYLYSLNRYNFPTKENPVGHDENRPYAKTGFTQTGIPTKEDLQKAGIYGSDPDSVFPQVPHVQNPHPDITPVNMKDVRECPDYDDGIKENEYIKWGHTNVPFAGSFGSASGQAAAWAYTAHSNTLNRILRYGLDGGTLSEVRDSHFWADDAAHVIKELDKMFAVSRVQEPMVVYRGIDHLSKKDFYDAFKKGSTIEDPGFASTSLNIRRALGFAAGNYGLIKIILPKGASAMSMKMREDGTAFSKYYPEEEILLPRNTKFRVIGFEKGKGDAADIKVPIVEIIP